MKKIFFIIFCFCCLSLIAQPTDSVQKSHDFLLGIGYMQMMNTAFLPSGLPAVNLSADYQYFKQDKKYQKNYWSYWLKAHFAFLQIKESQSVYYKLLNFYRSELKTGGVWLRKMPIKSTNFRFFLGAGVSLSSEFNFANSSKNASDFFSIPNCNWFLSPDFHVKADYNLKKIILQGEILLPLAMVGNYSEFNYTFANISDFAKNKLPPNTFVFLNKIFQPNISLLAKIPLNSNDQKQWFFLIKYAFESLDVNLKNFTEKKEQHDLRIGFSCEM